MTSSSTDGRRAYRHPAAVRIGHWLWTIALAVLTASGLAIFNASPNLDAADKSDASRRVLAISAEGLTSAHPIGVVRVAGYRFVTTGFLGYSQSGGRSARRAFPAWLTLPATRIHGLAFARHWHLFFGWILTFALAVYALARLRARRLSVLVPHPSGGSDYHVSQKIAYAVAVFFLFPLVILSGLALSPAIDAAADPLLMLFGGRQFARLWHFAAMLALLAFTFGHVVLVAATGLRPKFGAMLTGWYPMPPAEPP